MKMRKQLVLAFIIFMALFAAVPAQAATKRSAACTAYRKYLNTVISKKKLTYIWNDEKVTDSITTSSNYTFGLKDLNSDGIPELFLTGMFRGWRTMVATYYNGSMYQLDIDQGTAYYKFNGNKKLLVIAHETRGNISESYCIINKNKFVEVASRYYSLSNSKYTYYNKSNKQITKAEFLNAIKKYGVTLSTKKSSSRGNYKLTASNVKKRCK